MQVFCKTLFINDVHEDKTKTQRRSCTSYTQAKIRLITLLDKLNEKNLESTKFLE